MDVRARIRSYLGKVITKAVSDEDDIFELGLVDSLFGMQLVLFVEGEFSIVVAPEDLDIRHFCSVAAMTAFVEAKLGFAPPPQPGHGHQAD
jgi:acyl carrier protein